MAVLALLCLVAQPRGSEPLLQADDAVVETDDQGWIIGNALIRYGLTRTGTGVVARGIEDAASGRDWLRAQAPDSIVRVNGQVLTPGTPPLVFDRAAAVEWFGGVRLDLHFRVAAAGLEVQRSYACYPGSALIETWTTFRQDGGQSVTLADLTNYAFAIENGTLHWVGGLQTPDENGGPFTRYAGDLDDGQVFFLGSDRRSSETSLPWFTVSAGEEEFFGSIVWSGSWQFRTERRGDTVLVRLGLPPFDTTLAAGGTLETPHAVFGITNQVVSDTASAMQTFLRRLRGGRPFRSSVTYNTWYSKGTVMDEASITSEMDLAASIGVEQFVIDAGWWSGANTDDPGDFISRWGNWQVDFERFPNGLGYLSDYAHDRGMRFGMWVEPERVDRSQVGLPGLVRESFLATNDGRYDDDSAGPSAPAGTRRARSRSGRPKTMASGHGVSAQVCLVDASAREWLFGRLSEFIEEARLDYLKWDNNFWIACNREGHGHGPRDANFLHHQALNTMLDELRERFPDLEIENCASGGNRLSLAMLARTDAAWLDDRTDPSSRVRHSLQGLLGLLPPSYMLSFAAAALEGADETRSNSASYVFRSRMLGTPGMSWSLGGMAGYERSSLTADITIYKRVRPIVQQGAPILLSPQVLVSGWSGWDAVEHVVAGGREAVVMAYNTFDAPETAVVRPKRLIPEARYTVESADRGIVGSASGRALMADGIELYSPGEAVGHVLILSAE